MPTVGAVLGVVSFHPPPVAIGAHYAFHRDHAGSGGVVKDDDVPWTALPGAPGNPPLAIAQSWRHGLASDGDP